MGINLNSSTAIPSRTWAVLLSLVTIRAGIGFTSDLPRRHQENTGRDRIVPTVPQMARSTYDAAFSPRKRRASRCRKCGLTRTLLQACSGRTPRPHRGRFLQLGLIIPAVSWPPKGTFRTLESLCELCSSLTRLSLSRLPILSRFGMIEYLKSMMMYRRDPDNILDTFI